MAAILFLPKGPVFECLLESHTEIVQNGSKQTTVLYSFGTNTKPPSIEMFPVLGIWIPTVFRCLLFKFPLYIVLFVKFAWTLRTMTF